MTKITQYSKAALKKLRACKHDEIITKINTMLEMSDDGLINFNGFDSSFDESLHSIDTPLLFNNVLDSKAKKAVLPVHIQGYRQKINKILNRLSFQELREISTNLGCGESLPPPPPPPRFFCPEIERRQTKCTADVSNLATPIQGIREVVYRMFSILDELKSIGCSLEMRRGLFLLFKPAIETIIYRNLKSCLSLATEKYASSQSRDRCQPKLEQVKNEIDEIIKIYRDKYKQFFMPKLGRELLYRVLIKA